MSANYDPEPSHAVIVERIGNLSDRFDEFHKEFSTFRTAVVGFAAGLLLTGIGGLITYIVSLPNGV